MAANDVTRSLLLALLALREGLVDTPTLLGASKQLPPPQAAFSIGGNRLQNPRSSTPPADDGVESRPPTTRLLSRRRRRPQRFRMISEQAIEQPPVFTSLPVSCQGADGLGLQSSPFVANETVDPCHLLGGGRSRKIR